MKEETAKLTGEAGLSIIIISILAISAFNFINDPFMAIAAPIVIIASGSVISQIVMSRND